VIVPWNEEGAADAISATAGCCDRRPIPANMGVVRPDPGFWSTSGRTAEGGGLIWTR
jgi:hypothetical protein